MHFIMHIGESEMPNDVQTNFTAVNSFDKRSATQPLPTPANSQLNGPLQHSYATLAQCQSEQQQQQQQQ
ncbi:hypothetical protein AWZ03_011197 [Drosophila navojoa]|uniref:Uncharacterized protein n=1 Tax=Drosophila navojoa TaxID=7232 RepID=A0A484B2T9_DRONA|nr:hypothetical protein AWZ03_011197 [Drosophila navojoa]